MQLMMPKKHDRVPGEGLGSSQRSPSLGQGLGGVMQVLFVHTWPLGH
jgi:hypothetical protein